MATPSPSVVVLVDTKFFVKLMVTMPYTKSEFDQDKQVQYKAALASAAGTITENVDILAITDAHRRAGSVNVDTKVTISGRAESLLMMDGGSERHCVCAPSFTMIC